MQKKVKVEVLGFLDCFKDLKDHRINRKKLYPMEEILLVALCAIICGAEGWVDLALFGKQKLGALKRIFPFKNGIPTDDTFRRFFRRLEPKVFKECFIAWVKSLQQNITRDASVQTKQCVAIDGKSIRRSYDTASETSSIHMVAAWASESGLVLGQVKVNEKSNELTAIPQLLELIDLKGAVVTIDAMGCQKNIAKKIIDTGAHYILAVKENQKKLYQEIDKFFQYHKQHNYSLPDFGLKHELSIEKGHGRIETRKCIVTSDISWMDAKYNWPGINAIIAIESTRESIRNKTSSKETRYYISSLKNPTAADIAKMVRSHWAIENQVHWVLDVSFNEDQSRIRKGHAPENIAILRHLVLNLLKQAQSLFPNVSLKGLRKVAGWNDEVMLSVLKIF